ncbi:MAG: BON domain-containing protein [Armatimonadetes bacterium]|nr:BON domain-containing protein [Armatimonadota bacterium]
MSADEDQILKQDDGSPEAPAVVLPSPNALSPVNQGSGAAVGTGFPVFPQPVVSSGTGGAASDDLAARIEETLAEDGRFTGLLSRLTFAADAEGRVTLSGSLPDPALKPSLLATLHAVPGVTGVVDELA